MSLSRLVATSRGPSLGHAVCIHTSTFHLLPIRAYTSDYCSDRCRTLIKQVRKFRKFKFYATGFWHQTETFFNAIG